MGVTFYTITPCGHRLKMPETGRYHVIRLFRGDLKLNLFGGMFPVPTEPTREYVAAPIDVNEQKLKLFPGTTQVEEIDCKLH